MKKFFIMMAVAGAIASCNDSSTSGMTHEDSVRYQDSVDRANNVNTMPTNPTDTMNSMNTDSLNMNMKDTGMRRDSMPK